MNLRKFVFLIYVDCRYFAKNIYWPRIIFTVKHTTTPQSSTWSHQKLYSNFFSMEYVTRINFVNQLDTIFKAYISFSILLQKVFFYYYYYGGVDVIRVKDSRSINYCLFLWHISLVIQAKNYISKMEESNLQVYKLSSNSFGK